MSGSSRTASVPAVVRPTLPSDMKEATATTEMTTGVDHENGNGAGDPAETAPQPDAEQTEDATPLETEVETPEEEEEEEEPIAEKPIRDYKYKEGQWAPHNMSGAKRYERDFLLQLMDDPLAKIKPDNIPSAVVKFDRPEGSFSLAAITRPSNAVSFMPGFANSMMSPKRPNRDMGIMKKSNSMVSKPGPGMRPSGGPQSQQGSGKPNIIRVSLSLREDVKLNESANAWKPRVKTQLKNSQLADEDDETQDLYKKFRGILNKLTPEKFDRLLDQVKTLQINTEARLKGVINLVFEKAIEEPAFSEAYAAMCERLSKLQVPSEISPDQLVNFRVLLIHRCQATFQEQKINEQAIKLEKELVEATEPAKKKELQLMLDEENRKDRMRAVGNIRFIGELYKLKMLTPKIMVYCMDYLIDKMEEEKLEGLCKLLNTIGEQVESEAKPKVDQIFKKMSDIVERRVPNKICSRVRFMLQDTIDLKNRKWAKKNVIGSGPKTLGQIQKEAEQQHREIEIMNSGGGGGGRDGSRRGDDPRGRGGGGGGRGDGRRGGSQNYYADNNWQQTQTKTKYVVDTTKLKAVGSNSNKSLSNVKLGPPTNSWNFGSSTKTNPAPLAPTTNMFSVLDTVEPPPFVPPKELSGYQSMEKPGTRDNTGSRSASIEGTVSKVNKPALEEKPSAPVDSSVPAEPLTETDTKFVKAAVELSLVNPDDEELALEIKKKFKPQYQAGVVTAVINVALEKPTKTYPQISKSLLHLVSTNAISKDNLVIGLAEILEFAPDLLIDIPKLYDYLAIFVTPHIINKNITFNDVLKSSEAIISKEQGYMFLASIIGELKTAMGPSFAKAKWIESGLDLKQWMNDEQVLKFKNVHKFLYEHVPVEQPALETNTKKLSPQEVREKLLHLMHTEQSDEVIKGWVNDNVGKATSEDWFMRMLIQAICTYALFSSNGESATPNFNQDRMAKYIQLMNEYGESKDAREANCLYGIQQLLHRLEHPRGVALAIFQYLFDNYVIQREAFLAFETSEQEPEGKAVLLKALVSFYTDIKEADNEDSGSED